MTNKQIFERGELIWVLFNPQKGHEQAGRRPALVISPAAYNAVSNCIIVCPITSNTSPWPWKVDLPDDMDIKGCVLVDQAKSLDVLARKAEPANLTLSASLMDEVLAKLATLTS